MLLGAIYVDNDDNTKGITVSRQVNLVHYSLRVIYETLSYNTFSRLKQALFKSLCTTKGNRKYSFKDIIYTLSIFYEGQYDLTFKISV
jgi:hypothetical protein